MLDHDVRLPFAPMGFTPNSDWQRELTLALNAGDRLSVELAGIAECHAGAAEGVDGIGRELGAVADRITQVNLALKEQFEKRRQHSDHVLDDAWRAATSSRTTETVAVLRQWLLSAYKYCCPPNSGHRRLPKMDADAAVSMISAAIGVMGPLVVGHPDMRRIVATALQRELRHRGKEDQGIRGAELTDLGIDQIRGEAPESPADLVAIAEEVRIARELVAAIALRSGPEFKAAYDHLCGNGSRKALAAQHGVSVKGVRIAESKIADAILRKLSAAS